MTNVEATVKQIKAFNKALSRADKAGIISDDIYAAISDLIDPKRMTKAGYAKAGTKYLEGLSHQELLSYGADIDTARDLLEVGKLSDYLNIEGASDPKGLLLGLYNKMMDAGYNFDSDYVQAVIEGDTQISIKSMALRMNTYLTDPNYGLADFHEWFESQNRLG